MRFWILALCLLVAFFGVTTVGAATLQVYGPVLLYDLEAFIIPTFKEKFPDVEFELIPSGGATEKLKVLIASGLEPDIVIMPPRDFPEFVRAGALEPLDAYIAQSSGIDLENLPPATADQFGFAGRLYGIPFDGYLFNAEAIYINKTLFEQNGVPVPTVDYNDPYSGWTVDEFRDLALRFTVDITGDGAVDQWGYSARTETLGAWFRWLWTFGSELVSDSPEWRSSAVRPETIAAMQFLQDLNTVDKVVGPRAEFAGGRMAMAEGPVAYGFNQLAQVGFDWTVVAHPRGEGGRWGLALANPMSIMAASENKELAFAFLEHWLSDEVQLWMAAEYGIPPQTLSASTSSEFLFTDKPPYDRSAFVFGRSRGMPLWVPGWPEIMAEFRSAVNTIWSGGQPAANTLAQLDSQITRILAENQ